VRVVVFGAGAIGSLFGARLAQAGHNVLLVARPDHARAIRSSGLLVEGVRPATVQLEAKEMWPTTWGADAVLVGLKTYDLVAGGREIAAAAPHPRPLLAPQNGLGVESALAKGLVPGGWKAVESVLVRSVHSVPATLVGPGHIRQAGEGEVLLPIELPRAPAALDTWSALLESTGFRVRRVPDFERQVWKKAILNAAINPITADHNILNGQLLRDPWRGQALQLLRDAGSVAAAEGFSFTEEELETALWQVVRATAVNRSSMLQDIDRGRPTEIDAISGRILELGRAHRLHLPATQRAVDRIALRLAARSVAR
jgi:2-dehydropantoate 2-reductase